MVAVLVALEDYLQVVVAVVAVVEVAAFLAAAVVETGLGTPVALAAAAA